MFNFDLRRFDIYRKVPKDLTQPTRTGAIISITCVLFIVVLIYSELVGFLKTEIVSQVYVDNPNAEERIPVTIDIELPQLPCEFVGVDIQDDMGRHEVGFVDATTKTPINDEKGCLFFSKFHINKVPGNFHVSTHSAKNAPHNLDFSHKIKEIRFGEKIVAKQIPGSFNPLESVEKIVDKENKLWTMQSHDYTLKIVPTVYESATTLKKTVSYQYTVVYRTFIGHSHPAIWFRYDVSPLTVKYTQKYTPLYHFLTILCAIIGGVFTVANMIDGAIFSAGEWYKKWEMDKLS